MPPAPHSPIAEAQDHAALIVALDAGDLAGSERLAAESLAATCAGCAALVEDLAAIRGAMTDLPVVPRRRDYRLTAEDAARLRPSGWGRLLEWLAAPGSTVRPLATGLATLGVIGLLLTAGLPGGLSGLGGAGSASPVMAPEGTAGDAGGGSGNTELQGTYAPAAAPSGAPADEPGLAATAAPAALPAGTPSDDGAGVAGEAASGDPAVDRAGSTAPSDVAPGYGKSTEGDAAPAVPLPALASLALLAAGLALLAGRAVARRRLA